MQGKDFELKRAAGNLNSPKPYRGRLAPSPTGYLHAGHALTFWRAQERCRERGGRLVLRLEDLDRERARPEFGPALLEDLQWFGLGWDEGPFLQSERRALYLEAWKKLRAAGLLYPCDCSRRDLLYAAAAPHAEDEEPIYPGTCRPPRLTMPNETPPAGGASLERDALSSREPRSDRAERSNPPAAGRDDSPAGRNWRFRVPKRETMEFVDQSAGPQRAISGVDFGDFVVWRKDGTPAYQLAVVVDDAALGITEVVRGDDLLLSTFRQLLLYRALASPAPQFYHAPLVADSLGKRLAKRDHAFSLRALRAAGLGPEEIRQRFAR